MFDNFVSEGEERTFMKEMEPHLKRHVYEKDHWDDVSWGIILNIFITKQFFFRPYKGSERQKGNFLTKKIPV